MSNRDAILPRRTEAQIQKLIDHYETHKNLYDGFASGLVGHLKGHRDLGPLIHFIKYRLKSTDSLRRKLRGKADESRKTGKALPYTTANLFKKMNDLAGIRLLHLHTEQMDAIHKGIMEVFAEQKLDVVEAKAYCWDSDYAQFFEQCGIKPIQHSKMYTSVHYVVTANQATKITCEVQVRTLMDEVWGEVSHKVDYPDPTPSRVCKSQLGVLARLSSGGSRLVDSIFRSHNEAIESIARNKKSRSAKSRRLQKTRGSEGKIPRQ